MVRRADGARGKDADMKASVGKVAITTEELLANDTLFAKILLLCEGEATVAVISLDYISLGGDIGTLSDGFYPALRRGLAALGIGDVLCGATHTHTLEPMIVPEDEVLSRILHAAEALLGELRPVRLAFGTAHEGSFLLNRDLPLHDGSDWPVRQAHPLPPEGAYDRLSPADDRVNILRVLDDNGPVATLFTYGCHPLDGYANNRATAGFPGVAERLIETGAGGIAMMLQTTAGDVCELDYKNFGKPKSCEDNGRRLGEAVLSALGSLSPLGAGLGAATETAYLPYRRDFDEKIAAIEERERALCEAMGGCPLGFKAFLPLYLSYLTSPDYPLAEKYEYLREEELGSTQLRDQDKINRKNIEKYLANIARMEEISRLANERSVLLWHRDRVAALGNGVAVDVTGIRIGEIVLLSAPFEPLTSVGELLRERYGDRVWLASYSNGYQHYGATADKYGTDAYETRECDLAPEWTEAYLAAADRVIKALR